MRTPLLLSLGFLLLVGCKSSEPDPTLPVKGSSPPVVAKTDTPPVSAPTPPPAITPMAPNTPLEAQIAVDPYILGAPLTGRVVGYAPGQSLGTLILAICPSDEWRRAQSEGRPPVSIETTTVDLDRGEGNRFQFASVLDVSGGLMVYASDPDSRIRVRPVEARPRPGGPLDNAGPVDGVGTTGQGAPTDAFDPALRGTSGG